MISFDEAVAIICSLRGGLGKETVGLGDAHHRVLAEPVIARVHSPPTDVSAMDGYAVRDHDVAQLPARLPVAGQSFAGAGYDTELAEGTTVRIFTGAPVPAGADRVIIQEIVNRDGNIAIFANAPGQARHIRPRSSDFAAGTPLIEPGTRLGYRHLVAAAGADLSDLTVWRRPRVIILGTGDELAEPGTSADTPGTIPESVSFGVAALATDWGGQVLAKRRLRDDLPAMKVAATEAVTKGDLVVVTGGASVGERDFAKTMFEDVGLHLLFEKVAIKPGKPVWLGQAGSTYIMGLPGNPTSALVTARLLMAPLLAGLSGMDPESALAWITIPVTSPLPSCGDRETFVRARFEDKGVVPASNQDSSAQHTLAESDALIRRLPGGPEANAGDEVQALNF